MNIGTDLDGTVLIHPSKPEWVNELSLAEAYPDMDVVQHLERKVNATHGELSIITGRTEKVRFVTESQVHGLFGLVPVFMQRRWEGWDALTEWKATTIIEQGIEMYVGNHVTDEAAARMAGCKFTNVADLTSRRREAA